MWRVMKEWEHCKWERWRSPEHVGDYVSYVLARGGLLALNQVTKGDGYPISSVSNILDTLDGGKIFAKLDLASGYWQVPVNPQHIPKTAFVTHLGLFDFLRMPIQTAPQTFQCILNTVYSDFLYQWLIIHIDDIVIWSSEPTEALRQYEKVFQ